MTIVQWLLNLKKKETQEETEPEPTIKSKI